ncbi:MAG: methyltransferase domain-containing protein [Roseburia sp.]|nr:methyltransferase domain-containing protein [Roseburia sp.]
MSKQNIYDNDAFFGNFKSIRDSDINFNDLIETPILSAMLPDLHNKKILDIGCGMGQHAKQYSNMGAQSVLGIDISEKMLSYATEHNSADNIKYIKMAMEDIDTIPGKFDLITSSLAFDYIEDFDEMMRRCYRLLTDDGRLVFSMSHPFVTAWDGKYPRYTCLDTGERIYANIRNYWVEGKRKIKWVVDDYELYHRTLSSLINSIVKAGFTITECQESRISDEMRKQYPDVFGGTKHLSDFIFFGCKK